MLWRETPGCGMENKGDQGSKGRHVCDGVIDLESQRGWEGGIHVSGGEIEQWMEVRDSAF